MRSTLAVNCPVCPGRMSAFSTRLTRGEAAATTSTARFTTAIHAFHHVFVRIVAPVFRDGVGELLAIARRAVEVDLRHDKAARCEHLIVPARPPAVGPGAPLSAVDKVNRQVLLRGIEAGRL